MESDDDNLVPVSVLLQHDSVTTKKRKKKSAKTNSESISKKLKESETQTEEEDESSKSKNIHSEDGNAYTTIPKDTLENLPVKNKRSSTKKKDNTPPHAGKRSHTKRNNIPPPHGKTSSVVKTKSSKNKKKTSSEPNPETEDGTWKSFICPFLTEKPIADTWYRVKKRGIPPEILTIHRNNLSVRPAGSNFLTGKPLKPVICYEEDDVEFRVPFYYGILNFGNDFIDLRSTGQWAKEHFPNLEFVKSLNEDVLKQETACKEVLAKLLGDTFGTATLALPPGNGKTRCAIKIWIELCRSVDAVVPAFVLVHKKFLLDQWIERLQELVPNARIGVLHGGKYDYENKDIVICTIQSLIAEVLVDESQEEDDEQENLTDNNVAVEEEEKDKTDLKSGRLVPLATKKAHDDDENHGKENGNNSNKIKVARYSRDLFLKRYGFLIIDEAHRISAPKFSKSFPLTGMRWMLSVTGTPYRKDRTEKVMESWVGPVTFQTHKIYTRKVTVHPIDIKSDHVPTFKNRFEKLDNDRMLNDMCSSNERNEEIIDSLLPFIDEGRQILTLSTRCIKVPHLHILQEILFTKRPDIVSSVFYSKTKKKDRPKALQAQVIFSTFDMASEGLDIPSISGVAFLFGKEDVEQPVNRCIRGMFQLFDPVIIDFRDNMGLWWKKWHVRLRYYRKEGFDIVPFVSQGSLNGNEARITTTSTISTSSTTNSSLDRWLKHRNDDDDDEICPI